MIKGSVTKNRGRAHTPWAMWVPEGSPYGLEGWLCYGAGGAVREGWALCLCQVIHFADGLSQDSRLPHLCLHLLGLLHPPPVCLITASETVLRGYSSGMRSWGTGATWSLGASLILGTRCPSPLGPRSVHQFLPNQRPESAPDEWTFQEGCYQRLVPGQHDPGALFHLLQLLQVGLGPSKVSAKSWSQGHKGRRARPRGLVSGVSVMVGSQEVKILASVLPPTWYVTLARSRPWTLDSPSLKQGVHTTISIVPSIYGSLEWFLWENQESLLW